MDVDLHDAFIGDRRLGLTPREFQLLNVLVARRNQVVSTAELLEAMWGTAEVGGDHPIHVYMSRMRGKLSAGSSAQLIHTIRGRGYLYSPPAAPGTVVRLIYDRRLILRVIDPDDRPFLGWQPNDVIDTFFLLTHVSAINSSNRAALALARLWAAVGMTTWQGPTLVRTADGAVDTVLATLELITRNRRFLGFRATIAPVGHRL